MNTTEVAHTSICPRCQSSFTCGNANISTCFCSSIALSDAVRAQLQNDYSTCLCATCLQNLSSDYITPPKMKTVLGLLFVFLTCLVSAQNYPPAAGQIGTTAMHKDSSAFVEWANTCTVIRGYQDVSNKSLGLVSAGEGSMACGKAISNGVLSLGDGGSAVCRFPHLIYDGPGADFAVFENSFDGFFLEFAFVEVSSDGSNFFRFPASSLTDTSVQTDTYGLSDAKYVHNLAGKYAAGYGTPFDLQDLAGIPGLNIQTISHIRLIDVVGSVQSIYCSRDAQGRKINDPWPTPFPQGGFDLDAIGVIHASELTGIQNNQLSTFRIAPNPAMSGTSIKIDLPEFKNWKVISLAGETVLEGTEEQLPILQIPAGIYVLQVNDGLVQQKLVVYSSL